MTYGLLACPLCSSPLLAAAGGAWCPADGVSFDGHASGLPDLRPPGRRVACDEFARRYREARVAEGLLPLKPEGARELPYGAPPGYAPLYWQVRRESFAALLSVLRRAERALVIADLGAGMPWLSYRLAQRGNRVVAIDLSPDPDYGLGAARHFPPATEQTPAIGQFQPVLGDLEAPPLAPGRFDWVICNASLHYATDLSATLQRITTALRPGGAVIVLDSPVAYEPRPSASGGRVLSAEEVAQSLRNAGLQADWRTVPRGWLWRRHQLKNRLLRRSLFDFPLIVAYVPGPAQGPS